MDVLLSIIFDFLIEVPGAFLCWAFKGFKGTLKQEIKAPGWRNGLVGIIFWAFLLWIVILIMRSISPI